MTTPYMSLVLPVPSVTAGPAWASAINTALTTVDGHDHSSGSGKPVRASALSIDADVSWNNNNVTELRSLRLYNQAAALALGTDVGCVYEAGGDLYYNNSAGQQVQITAGAALSAASIGAIGGDYATSGASEFYTSASHTFFFWQSANKAASLDAGNVIIREPGVSSAHSVTLQSPAALAADYAVTFPAALPGVTSLLTVSSSGQIAAGLSLSELNLTPGHLHFQSASDQYIQKHNTTGGLWIFTDGAADLHLGTAGGGTATHDWYIAHATGSLTRVRGTVTGLPTPSASSDAATKGYVDGADAAITSGSISAATGWIIINYTLRKQANGLVILNVDVSRDSGSTTLAFTLPSGYRPSFAMQAAGLNATAGTVGAFQVSTNGNVDYMSGISNGQQLYLHLVFPAA